MNYSPFVPQENPTIQVEFFGVPRERTGVASFEVTAGTIAVALRSVADEFPEFATCCMSGDQLADGLIMNLNGEVFLSGLDVPLTAGDALLVMSADVGG